MLSKGVKRGNIETYIKIMKEEKLFIQLSPGLKRRLIRNLLGVRLLKGEDVTEEGVERILMSKPSAYLIRWNFRNLAYMQKIDSLRKNMGLSPIHFVDN